MENKTNTSLFEYISEAVVDGQLPDDFSLPQEKKDNEIRWMDGAFDGVAIFHMGLSEISNENKSLMMDAVKEASNGNRDKADALFCKFAKEVRAIAAIDELQSYVIENKEILSAGNLSQYAIHLMMDSSDKECVKFGLSLLELFDMEEDEEMRNVIRILGLSDEFTIFSLFIMSQWRDGNQEIFELAQKVHGWGRIHAIERLEPETEEIKIWLLQKGVHNQILPAYSALLCWEKTEAENILQGELSIEDFSGIRDIIIGLLDEGPVPGISELEDSVEIIITFVNKAKKMTLALEDYEAVHTIRLYFEEEERKNETIVYLCQEILQSEDCRKQVAKAVKSGFALELADELKIDYKADICQLLKTDFEKHFYLCAHVMEDLACKTEVLQIFRQNLPLDSMKTAPTDSLGLGSDYKLQNQLECIVQQLWRYPLEGIEFVETALQSAPIRTRNCGITTLESWISAKKKPLKELVPDLYDLICKLHDIEIKEDIKKSMERLIMGEMAFSNVIEDADEDDSV